MWISPGCGGWWFKTWRGYGGEPTYYLWIWVPLTDWGLTSKTLVDYSIQHDDSFESSYT